MKGEALPLFTRTIYAEQVSENIMSVPEAVDKGYAVLFNDDAKAKVLAYPILRGARDPRNRLYYISFPSPQVQT